VAAVLLIAFVDALVGVLRAAPPSYAAHPERDAAAGPITREG